jgi:hypothetical protein
MNHRPIRKALTRIAWLARPISPIVEILSRTDATRPSAPIAAIRRESTSILFENSEAAQSGESYDSQLIAAHGPPKL